MEPIGSGPSGESLPLYRRLSEKLAVRFCHALISDSKDVQEYYQEEHKAQTSCIVYGIRERRSRRHDVLDQFHLKQRGYVLFVGRLVPENNIHHLIHAFEKVETDLRLVIVGDDPWEKTYVQVLKSTVESKDYFYRRCLRRRLCAVAAECLYVRVA